MINETPSPEDCTSFIKTWVGRGWEYCLLETGAQPSYTNKSSWRSDFPSLAPDALFGLHNVGLRKLDVIAIRVSEAFDEPLHQCGPFKFLRGLGNTLRFEAGDTACFCFRIKPAIHKIGEHNLGERTHSGPLAGTVLSRSNGFLGFGLAYDGVAPVRVSCEGKLMDLTDLPALYEALKMTGKFEEIGFLL